MFQALGVVWSADRPRTALATERAGSAAWQSEGASPLPAALGNGAHIRRRRAGVLWRCLAAPGLQAEQLRGGISQSARTRIASQLPQTRSRFMQKLVDDRQRHRLHAAALLLGKIVAKAQQRSLRFRLGDLLRPRA